MFRRRARFAHPFSRSCMGRNTEANLLRDGVLDTFWQSNIGLVSENPQLDIYDQSWPILVILLSLSIKIFLQTPMCTL